LIDIDGVAFSIELLELGHTLCHLFLEKNSGK